MHTDFATNLIYLRGAKNLTQQELGDAAGVSPSQISRYEAGIASPRKTVLRKLADALGVSVEQLTRTEPATIELPDGQEISTFVPGFLMDRLREIAKATGKPLSECFGDAFETAVEQAYEQATSQGMGTQEGPTKTTP